MALATACSIKNTNVPQRLDPHGPVSTAFRETTIAKMRARRLCVALVALATESANGDVLHLIAID